MNKNFLLPNDLWEEFLLRSNGILRFEHQGHLLELRLVQDESLSNSRSQKGTQGPSQPFSIKQTMSYIPSSEATLLDDFPEINPFSVSPQSVTPVKSLSQKEGFSKEESLRDTKKEDFSGDSTYVEGSLDSASNAVLESLLDDIVKGELDSSTASLSLNLPSGKTVQPRMTNLHLAGIGKVEELDELIPLDQSKTVVVQAFQGEEEEKED